MHPHPPDFEAFQPTRETPPLLEAHTMSTTNNIYKEDVDFAALALQDAEFAKA